MREQTRSPRGSVDVADLVAEATRGAPWAVESLVAEYRPRLVGYARARGAAEPEGIADVALTTVLNRLPELAFDAPEPLWAYLCLTARSRLIDEHRRHRPVELTGDPEAIDGAGSAATPFDDRVADRQYITALLDPLTDEQRRVLELRFLEDLSVEETANRTGRTEGAVKTMQRRAINAILAAVAVLLAVLAIRGLGDRPIGTDADLDDSPAGEVDTTDTTTPDGDEGRNLGNGDGSPDGDAGPDDDASRDDDGSRDDDASRDPDADGAVRVESPDGDPDDVVTTTTNPDLGPGAADEADGETAPDAAVGPTRIDLSAGTTEAGGLITSGQPGEARLHGARIRCQAAHLSHDDPVAWSDQPGRSPARLHWGNTAVDASTTGAELRGTGAGTCDGGISDRSAYAMPALIDDQGRAVVPDTILVEYKSFGGPGFDRSTVRPIPAGLQLVADPTVANGEGRVGGASVDGGGTVKIDIAFPSCVRVGPAGQPVLRSADGVGHLSYPSTEDGRPDECPATHPYRVPQLGYRLTFPVAWDSDWSLASAPTAPGPETTVTASAVSAWDPSAMDDVVTCVRDLLEGCWFAGLDRPPQPSTPGPVELAAFDPRPTT